MIDTVQGALRNWTTNLDDTENCPASRAFSKALRCAGITTGPNVGGVKVRIYCPITGAYSFTDEYLVRIAERDADRVIAELRKDARVTKIERNGVDVTEAAKTVEELQAELDAFKLKVYRVAKAKAKQHDWCSVVDDALKEMGIDPPKRMTRVTLEFEVPADVDPDDFNSVKDYIAREFLWHHIYGAMRTVEPIEG